MHLIRVHRLQYIQLPQVITHLIFTFSGRDFAPPVLILLSIHSRGMERVCHWRLRQKSCWVPQPPHLLLPVFQCCWSGANTFDFSFLVNRPVEALPFTLCLPCQVQFQLHFGHPYTTELCLYTLPRWPALASTVYAFASFPLV